MAEGVVLFGIVAPFVIIFDIENKLSSTYQSGTEGVNRENQQFEDIFQMKHGEVLM